MGLIRCPEKSVRNQTSHESDDLKCTAELLSNLATKQRFTVLI